MSKWPFRSYIPEEDLLRSQLPNSSNLVILFHIFDYYVAVDHSALLLSNLATPTVSKIGKRKLSWIVFKDSISIPNLLTKIPKCHIAINRVNL